MPHISHTAKFSPDDRPLRIVDDLACPICGHLDPGEAHNWITNNEMRIFCEGCGAFVTVLLSAEQAHAIQRCSASLLG